MNLVEFHLAEPVNPLSKVGFRQFAFPTQPLKRQMNLCVKQQSPGLQLQLDNSHRLKIFVIRPGEENRRLRQVAAWLQAQLVPVNVAQQLVLGNQPAFAMRNLQSKCGECPFGFDHAPNDAGYDEKRRRLDIF